MASTVVRRLADIHDVKLQRDTHGLLLDNAQKHQRCYYIQH